MTIEILTASLSYHNIDPEIFRIGPFVLRWYSLGYILGLLFGWWYLMRLADEPKAPMTRPQADSFLLWATFGVILGGRLGYVLFYNLPFYMDNPSGILRVWDGGMSFHGGLLGVMAAVNRSYGACWTMFNTSLRMCSVCSGQKVIIVKPSLTHWAT